MAQITASCPFQIVMSPLVGASVHVNNHFSRHCFQLMVICKGEARFKFYVTDERYHGANAEPDGVVELWLISHYLPSDAANIWCYDYP